MPTVTLIHATQVAMPPVIEAFRALPGVRLLNQLDEALLAEITRHGGLTEECVARMTTQISLAVQAGSNAVLTTCNAYSAVVMHTIRPRLEHSVPVLVVDEPMIRQAVRADRIAVLATVAAGLESQRELLGLVADEQGRKPETSFVLRSDAFDLLVAGSAAEHDKILLAEIDRLADGADVVVLAQASMARVLPSVPARYRDRVLSSPRLAVNEVARLLGIRPAPTGPVA
jgi:hypothetical protein